MKLVNWDEFTSLPPGRLCIEYEPCVFVGGLFVKDETILDGDDFRYTPIIDAVDGEWIQKLFDEGAEYKVAYFSPVRSGRFDRDRQFVVFDDDDLLAIRDMFDSLISG